MMLRQRKSLTELDSAEGSLSGSDVGGRTKIRQASAIPIRKKDYYNRMRKTKNLMISEANRESLIELDQLMIDQGGECCEIINMNETLLIKLNRQESQVTVHMGDTEENLCFMLFLDNYVQKKKKGRVLRNIINET